MKKILVLLLSLVVLAQIGFAAVVESGDNGVQFASEVSREKCALAQTQTVYICKGNVVKVVSSDQVSTFYKPDGRIVTCPKGASPAQMGAECVQLQMPNICPNESVCGQSAQTNFPGQNTSSTVYNGEGEVVNTTNSTPPPINNTVEPTIRPTVTNNQPVVNTNNQENQNVNEEIINSVPTKSLDSAPDNLIYIIFGLGIASLIVLFFMFRKTLSE
jgi:hypothetical protein